MRKLNYCFAANSHFEPLITKIKRVINELGRLLFTQHEWRLADRLGYFSSKKVDLDLFVAAIQNQAEVYGKQGNLC